MEIEINCINVSSESNFTVKTKVKEKNYKDIIMKNGLFELKNGERFNNITKAAERNYEIINKNVYEIALLDKLNNNEIDDNEFQNILNNS